MVTEIYDLGIVKDEQLKFAVIVSKFNGKFVYAKHKKRDTWEIPGGHRELNEEINVTAERELKEETGAINFKITPVCDYSVKREGQDKDYGRVYYAQIEELGELPDFEIGEIGLFDYIPEKLTYPEIQPLILKGIMKYRLEDEWFTIERIDNETYAISEYGHWEKVHSYLLIGRNKALLIDTGLGIGNIKKEVQKLTKLPVIVVTTHIHWDHIGGHHLFDTIYVYKDELDWLRNGIGIPINVIKKNIMEEPFTKKPPIEFSIDNYKIYNGEPKRILKDNDIIDIGQRKLRIIHTPGHSPGHICIFEEERGYLYTGDLIYRGTLYAFYPTTDPVLFKKSVDKISKLKGIARLLPAHNDINISITLMYDIKKAFKDIKDKNMLKQGSGIFDFDEFRIKI